MKYQLSERRYQMAKQKSMRTSLIEFQMMVIATQRRGYVN